VSFAELWSATGVKVSSTPTTLSLIEGCSNLLNVGSAGNWLNSVGLIKDAQASVTVEVTLSSVDEGDNFRFTHSDYSINMVRQLMLAACGPMSVFCPGATGNQGP